MKIKTVEISGMNNVIHKVYNLGDFTYLQGPNGSGKSTVLEAVGFALFGYIPGEDKRVSSVGKHAPFNNLVVRVTFDDNSFIQRSCTGSGTRVSSHVEKSKDLDIDSLTGKSEDPLPVFEFDDFMNLSANKMKEWFLKFLPSESSEIDWKTEITDYLKACDLENINDIKLDNMIKMIKGYKLSGIKEVQQANQFFKDNLSAAKKDLQRAQSTFQSLALEDADITDDRDDLESKIETWTRLKERQTYDGSVRKFNDSVAVQIQKYHQQGYTYEGADQDPRYIDLKTKLSDQQNRSAQLVRENDLNAMDTELHNLSNQSSQIQGQINVLNSFVTAGTTCPILNRECTDLKSHKSECESQIAVLKQQMTEIETQYKEKYQKYNNIKLEINSANTEVHDLTIKVTTIENSYADIQKLKGMLSKPSTDTPDITDYDALINDANDRINKIVAAEKTKALYEQSMKVTAELQIEVEQYKALVKLTGPSGLQAKLANDNDPFVQLVTPMNKLISGWNKDLGSVYFNNESKSNSFEFGVVRNGNKIAYRLMSSGEKCLFALALFISLTNMSKATLKTILVDDAFDHLDDIAFQNVIFSLYNPDKIESYQLIVAGIKPVQGEFVKEVIPEKTQED